MSPNSAPVDAPAMVPGSMVAQGPDAGGVQTPAASYVPIRAMEDVMAARAEQIFRHGHTPQSDSARPLGEFTEDIYQRVKALREGVQFNQARAVQRRRLVKLAALCLAAIDRLDSEQEGNPLG
jgi:hypothetical protein